MEENYEQENPEMNENQPEEISKEDSMSCPACGYNKKMKIESLRRIEGNKVKPFDILVCRNCGSFYTDQDKLSDSL